MILQAAAFEVDAVAPARLLVNDQTNVTVAAVGRWAFAGGATGGLGGDELAGVLLDAATTPAAKLSLLRSAEAASSGEGAPTRMLERLVYDADEAVARVAARALARRSGSSSTAESALLRRAASAPESVRGAINARLGGRCFDSLWDRYDRLPIASRGAAGRTLLKLLPAAGERLRRKILTSPPAERARALSMARAFGAAAELRGAVLRLLRSPRAARPQRRDLGVGRRAVGRAGRAGLATARNAAGGRRRPRAGRCDGGPGPTRADGHGPAAAGAGQAGQEPRGGPTRSGRRTTWAWRMSRRR